MMKLRLRKMLESIRGDTVEAAIRIDVYGHAPVFVPECSHVARRSSGLLRLKPRSTAMLRI